MSSHNATVAKFAISEANCVTPMSQLWFSPEDFESYRLLADEMRSGTRRHARTVLFVGPPETGKRTLAHTIARYAECFSLGGDPPCGQCNPCRAPWFTPEVALTNVAFNTWSSGRITGPLLTKEGLKAFQKRFDKKSRRAVAVVDGVDLISSELQTTVAECVAWKSVRWLCTAESESPISHDLLNSFDLIVTIQPPGVDVVTAALSSYLRQRGRTHRPSDVEDTARKCTYPGEAIGAWERAHPL